MALRTSTDFWEIACSSRSERLPAFGISRSMTNFGMRHLEEFFTAFILPEMWNGAIVVARTLLCARTAGLQKARAAKAPAARSENPNRFLKTPAASGGPATTNDDQPTSSDVVVQVELVGMRP